MHGGPGHLHPRGENRLVDPFAVVALSGKGGDQRRMNVEGAPLVAIAQFEEREEAEQGDQVDRVFVEGRVEGIVEGRPAFVLVSRYGDGGNTPLPRPLETKSLFLRSDHHGDLPGDFSPVDVFEEVFETGPVSREQDGDPKGAGGGHEKRFAWMRRVAGDRFRV